MEVGHRLSKNIFVFRISYLTQNSPRSIDFIFITHTHIYIYTECFEVQEILHIRCSVAGH